MTFLEHVEELRAAVWRSVAIAVILIATAWFFSGLSSSARARP